MKSFLAFFALFFLLSFASLIDGRRCPGSYWKTVMKNEPMPEVIAGLLHGGSADSDSGSGSDSGEKENNGATPCASSMNTGKPVLDFDIRPNVIIYHSLADSRKSGEEP